MKSEQSNDALIDEKLLEKLACPKCRGKIRIDQQRSALVCDNCRLSYAIKDGIPVLLPEDAERF